MSDTRNAIPVTAGAIIRGGRLLAARRPPGPRLAVVVYKYPDIVIQLMVYTCSLGNCEPVAREHAELRWRRLKLNWGPVRAIRKRAFVLSAGRMQR